MGTVFYNYFSRGEPVTVDVPGNIITPDSEDAAGIDNNSSDSQTKKSQGSEESIMPKDDSISRSETTKETLAGAAKAGALSLHSRQPEENTTFQVMNLFPGDNETKFFRIRLSYKGDIIVRYHADIRPGYEKLAEVLKVRIRLPDLDELLYDGLMRDMPRPLEHALYTNKSTKSELYYEITAYLDTSVGNEYMDKNLIADFRWWVEETDNLEALQTGDMTNIYPWICLACGSLILLLFLLGKCRKGAVDEKG